MAPLVVAAVAETVAQSGSMKVAMMEEPPEGMEEEAVVGVVAESNRGPPDRLGLMQL